MDLQMFMKNADINKGIIDKGNILENKKIIGKCKEIKNVNLEDNWCPVMGKDFSLYHCKRCRFFEKIHA